VIDLIFLGPLNVKQSFDRFHVIDLLPVLELFHFTGVQVPSLLFLPSFRAPARRHVDFVSSFFGG